MKYSKIGFPINLKLSQSVSKNNTVSGGRLLVHEFYVTLVLIPVQTWQNFQVIFPGLKYSFFSTSSALSLCHIRTYSQLHTTHSCLSPRSPIAGKMSMWGGGITPPRPPPRPPSVAPPSGAPVATSDGKIYADNRQSELEELRQRGLAKLLNKHFTTVTKAISEERAAAEAALRDLEARKANTSEFTGSTNGITMYEHLYMQVQEKKAACKRKERETLILYQRYVDKFGNTGAVAVPNSRDMKIGMPPVTHTKSTPTSSYIPAKLTPSVKITHMTDEIEDNLLKHVSSGGDALPSGHTMGVEETLQSRRATEEREFSEFSRRCLEAKGVDAVAKPRGTSKKVASASQFGIAVTPDVKTSVNSATPSAQETSAEDDDDDRSAVSGLTSVASHVASEAEIQLLDFLKTETETIRKMMEDDESTSNTSGFTLRSSMVTSPSNSAVGALESAQAADKAEDMVLQMKKMLSDHETPKDGPEKKSFQPYELETSNPNEKWLVCYDDNHHREYYHETKMGLTQWEKPNTDDEYAPMVDYTKSSISYTDVRPGSMLTRVSRRDIYRQTQRLRRNRRRILALLIGAFAFVATYYVYDCNQRDPVFAERVSRVLMEPAERMLDRLVGVERMNEINHVIYKTAIKFTPSSVSEDTERRIRQEAERTVRSEINQVEKERLERLEAKRKAKEEHDHAVAQEKKEKQVKEQKRKDAERLAKEAANQKEADRKDRERQLQQEASRQELERRALVETTQKELNAKAIKNQTKREREEAKRQQIEQRKRRAMMRPGYCNLPMIYVISKRCRKLSISNPIFDLRSFVDAMMQ